MDYFLVRALKAAIRAAAAILKIYQSDFSVSEKPDTSPLTLADKHSHQIITSSLKPLGIPIISEEGQKIPYAKRKAWNSFWLVDPLDGTKEFIRRNGEFTVNIDLIQDRIPVMGIICIPVLGITYFAEKNIGTFKLEDPILINRIGSEALDATGFELSEIATESNRLPLSMHRKDSYIIVGSRSHATPELEAFVGAKRLEFKNVTFIPVGSSLKFCRVAEGRAAIYPRLGPTMEWDTAAGHAIATCAGARVVSYDTGEPLFYNKENLENPWFIVENVNVKKEGL